MQRRSGRRLRRVVQRIDPPVYHGEAAKRRRGPGRMWPTRHVRGRGRSSARRSRVRSRRPAATAHPIPHGSGIPHSVVSHTAVVSHTISRIGGGLLSNARMFCFRRPFPPAGSSGRSAVAVRRTSRTTTPHGIACMAVPSSSFFPASLRRSSRKQRAAHGRDRQGPDGDRTGRDGPRTTKNKSQNKQTNNQTQHRGPSARAGLAAQPSLVTASTAHIR